MKNNLLKKKVSVLGSLLSLGLFILVVGAGCSSEVPNTKNNSVTSSHTISSSTSEMPKLTTYENKELGFSVQYPEDWKMKIQSAGDNKEFEGVTDITFLPPIAHDTQSINTSSLFIIVSTKLTSEQIIALQNKGLRSQRPVTKVITDFFRSNTDFFTFGPSETINGLMYRNVCGTWKEKGKEHKDCRIWFVESSLSNHLPTYYIRDSTDLKLYKTFKLLSAKKTN